MLIQSKQAFAMLPAPSKGKPLINENFVPAVVGISDQRTSDSRVLMRWVKASPEPLGIVNRISSDVVQPVSFKALDRSKGAGRPSDKAGKGDEREAMDFYKKTFFRQVDTDSVNDELITGDGYIWKGKISEAQVKEVAGRVCKGGKSGKEFKEIGMEFKVSDFIDEDFQGINTVQHVPATTMVIDFNNTIVKGFVQNVSSTIVGSGTVSWDTDQIIHGTYMNLDGKVHGYTPMFANRAVIQIMGLIKDYMGNYFKGGGTPDLIFAFESTVPPAVKQLIEHTLKEYKDNKKRGHMVVSGSKFKLERINEWNKDMEFHLLAVYATGVLAYSFGMPTSFLGPILGSVIKQSTGGVDSSEGAYWKNIQAYQQRREDLLNSQLWIPEFGVEMRYDKPYLIDEIKESQNKMFINDALAKSQFLYMSYGKRIKVETLNRLLGFSESDLEDAPEGEFGFGAEFTPGMAGGGGKPGMPGNRQGQPDNQSIKGGDAKDQLRTIKKTQAG